MKEVIAAFVIILSIAAVLFAQGRKISELKSENAKLSQELALTNQLRAADQAAYSEHLKVLMEARRVHEAQSDALGQLNGLGDADFLLGVKRVFLKGADASGNASGVPSGTMSGTASAGESAKGDND